MTRKLIRGTIEAAHGDTQLLLLLSIFILYFYNSLWWISMFDTLVVDELLIWSND